MKIIAVKCRHLVSLDVSQTAGGITDETMTLVAHNCPKFLNVSYTEGKITDASMQLVFANCRYWSMSISLVTKE